MAQLCLRDAWPAPETHDIDGWQIRAGQGGYNRANSVWPGTFSGGDLSRAVEAAEALYRGRNLAPRFQILDIAQPANLDAELARRGYVRDVACSDLTKAVDAHAVMPQDVTVALEATDGWRTAYLSQQSTARAAELPLILSRLSLRRGFIVCRRHGAVAGVALVSASGEYAAVDCVLTLPEARRSGVGRSVMGAAEAWAAGVGASRLLLSVVDGNSGAVALYRSLGYRRFAGYHYRFAAA